MFAGLAASAETAAPHRAARLSVDNSDYMRNGD